MFISLDGLDGSGKSTQVTLLAEWLRSRGADVVTCRDPGSTDLGTRVRELLLGDHETKIDVRAEMFLYMTARAQLVDELIVPALNQGKTVISDRFLLANVVYQGHAGGITASTIWQIGETATRGIAPDLTIVLDAPPEAALARLPEERDRIERRDSQFRAAVREGFLSEAAARPDRIIVVNADRPIDAVHEDIKSLVLERVESEHRDAEAGT